MLSIYFDFLIKLEHKRAQTFTVVNALPIFFFFFIYAPVFICVCVCLCECTLLLLLVALLNTSAVSVSRFHFSLLLPFSHRRSTSTSDYAKWKSAHAKKENLMWKLTRSETATNATRQRMPRARAKTNWTGKQKNMKILRQMAKQIHINCFTMSEGKRIKKSPHSFSPTVLGHTDTIYKLTHLLFNSIPLSMQKHLKLR